MSLSRENVKEDIQKYIEDTLNECLEKNRLKLVNPLLVLEIISALEHGADGMILWARLLIEEICSQDNDRKILQALRSLPKHLSELFDRKLERLKATRHAEDAIKTLQFCGVVERPLTTDEIREALTIRMDQKSLDVSSLSNDIGQIIADCCGLVYVEEEDLTVHYIHHSVYQHLFDNTQSHRPRFDKVALDKHLGLLCLTYINFTDFSRQLVKTSKGSDVKIEPWKIGATAVTGLSETSNSLALTILRSSRRGATVRDLKMHAQDLLGIDDNARLQSELKLRRFQFLLYVQKHWICHLTYLKEIDGQRLWQVFGKCVDGTITIVDRPWETLEPAVQPNLNRNGLAWGERQWVFDLLKKNSRCDVRWVVSNQHTALLLWMIHESHSALTSEELGNLLFGCSRHGDVHMMKLLIDHAQLTKYQTSLALAVSAAHGSLDGLEVLLEAGASCEQRWKERTALQAAAAGGYIQVVERLLAAKADLNAPPGKYNGCTALEAAAKHGHIAVVERLLAAQADVHPALRGDFDRPLVSAARAGHEVVIKLLLEKGAKQESKDKNGQTPLSWAARSGREAVVKLLIKKGANLESQDNNGWTPLFWAAKSGHEAVVKLLLKKGANLEFTDEDGQKLLSCAAGYGHGAVVKLLLTKGADLESKDKDGRTPLTWAALNGHEAVVKLLVEKGAALESQDNNGWTPLSWAAHSGSQAIPKMESLTGYTLPSNLTTSR